MSSLGLRGCRDLSEDGQAVDHQVHTIMRSSNHNMSYLSAMCECASSNWNCRQNITKKEDAKSHRLAELYAFKETHTLPGQPKYFCRVP